MLFKAPTEVFYVVTNEQGVFSSRHKAKWKDGEASIDPLFAIEGGASGECLPRSASFFYGANVTREESEMKETRQQRPAADGDRSPSSFPDTREASPEAPPRVAAESKEASVLPWPTQHEDDEL